MLLSYQGRHVQHMQKALAQMNVQLANVISDIAGETGQRIVRAIIAGERDGQVLAKMKNARIRASEAEIVKSLRGNWREEHLFTLRQAMALYDAYGERLAECDQQLEAMLAALQTQAGDPGKDRRRSRARNAPKFDVRAYLFGMCGVDLTRINGIDTTTALKVISEIGTDLSRFKSAKHFASWLGLCPGTKISGGRSFREHPGVPRTGRRRRYGWRHRPCAVVSQRWGLITVACVRVWTGPRRSPLPPISLLASSTRC